MELIALAGNAPVEYDTLRELMADWLPSPSAPSARFLLPIDGDLTDTTATYANWLYDLELSYTIITNSDDLDEDIRDDAAEVVFADDVVKATIAALELARSTTHHPVTLVLAWGEGDAPPDEITELFLDHAISADILVKDVTAGLDDVVFIEGAEPEPEPVKTTRSRRKPLELVAEDKPLSEKEAAMSRHPSAKEPKPTMAELAATEVNATKLAEHALSAAAITVTNAEVQQVSAGDVILVRTTLQAVRRHLVYLINAFGGLPVVEDLARQVEETLALLNTAALPASMRQSVPVHGDADAEGVLVDAKQLAVPTEPKVRGRARAKADKKVKVFVDEVAGTVRKPPGRGRPKKGEVAIELTEDEIRAKYGDIDLS